MTNLATDLLAARRTADLSPEAMALRAKVDVEDVRRVEAGEHVGRAATERLCAMLALPPLPAPERPTHGWLVRVAAADDAHAANLERLEGAAVGGGHVLASDVVTHDALTHWSASRARVRMFLSPMLEAAGLSLGFPASLAGVFGLISVACSLVFAMQGAAFWLSSNPNAASYFADTLKALEMGTGGLGLAASALGVIYGVKRMLDRVLPWLYAKGDRWNGRGDMRSMAYVLTRSGVSVLRVRGEGVTRQDLPASGYKKVDVYPHGKTHLTVTVRHEGGNTVLAWLPRDGELDEIVEAWRSALPVPPPVYGATYAVTPRQVLDGRP